MGVKTDFLTDAELRALQLPFRILFQDTPPREGFWKASPLELQYFHKGVIRGSCSLTSRSHEVCLWMTECVTQWEFTDARRK